MSLNVSEKIVQQARAGKVDGAEFIDTVRASLPAAWSIFERLAAALKAKSSGFAVYAPDHMEDADRGQLLRAMASNAIHGAVERHFGCAFAFQNCHKVGAIRTAEVGSDTWNDFTSPEAQILQQQPQFRDC